MGEPSSFREQTQFVAEGSSELLLQIWLWAMSNKINAVLIVLTFLTGAIVILGIALRSRFKKFIGPWAAWLNDFVNKEDG